MEAKELRIGNLVLVEETITEIESISETGINITACGGYYPGEDEIEHEAYFLGWGSSFGVIVKPIPLNEEWLLKFGFEKRGLWVKEAENMVIAISTKDGSLGVYSSIEYYRIGTGVNFGYIRFKHVHQLQNLYFALTGEELELKK